MRVQERPGGPYWRLLRLPANNTISHTILWITLGLILTLGGCVRRTDVSGSTNNARLLQGVESVKSVSPPAVYSESPTPDPHPGLWTILAGHYTPQQSPPGQHGHGEDVGRRYRRRLSISSALPKTSVPQSTSLQDESNYLRILSLVSSGATDSEKERGRSNKDVTVSSSGDEYDSGGRQYERHWIHNNSKPNIREYIDSDSSKQIESKRLKYIALKNNEHNNNRRYSSHSSSTYSRMAGDIEARQIMFFSSFNAWFSAFQDTFKRDMIFNVGKIGGLMLLHYLAPDLAAWLTTSFGTNG